jgi:hypothetical protein
MEIPPLAMKDKDETTIIDQGKRGAGILDRSEATGTDELDPTMT